MITGVDESTTGDSEKAGAASDDLAGALHQDNTEDYHALSAKEEMDLEAMMNQCDFAISDAEKFADQLSSDLSVLDGVCSFDITNF